MATTWIKTLEGDLCAVCAQALHPRTAVEPKHEVAVVPLADGEPEEEEVVLGGAGTSLDVKGECAAGRLCRACTENPKKFAALEGCSLKGNTLAKVILTLSRFSGTQFWLKPATKVCVTLAGRLLLSRHPDLGVEAVLLMQPQPATNRLVEVDLAMQRDMKRVIDMQPGREWSSTEVYSPFGWKDDHKRTVRLNPNKPADQVPVETPTFLKVQTKYASREFRSALEAADKHMVELDLILGRVVIMTRLGVMHWVPTAVRVEGWVDKF